MKSFRVALMVLLAAAASPALAASPLAVSPQLRAPPQVNASALKVMIPPTKVKVTVAGSGQGVVSYGSPMKLCGSKKYPQFSACEIVVPLGQAMTLKPSPDTGTVFVGWEGACTGKGACTLKGAGGALALTARFETEASQSSPAPPKVHKLSVATGGEPSAFAWVTSAPVGISCGGNGTEQCWLNFLAGQEVLLVSSASTSEPRNVEWIGCTPIGSDKKTCKVTMDADKNVAVIFSKP